MLLNHGNSGYSLFFVFISISFESRQTTGSSHLRFLPPHLGLGTNSLLEHEFKL